MKDFIKESEKVFKGKVNLKYLFIENKYSKKLLVTFSGYSHDSKITASYNYINCVEDININRLYILDDFAFENRGCWYIGENGGNEVEESTILLITKIAGDNKICWEDVIFAGSSKGGFAALYLGIKYNVANIIAGGPQILLGNYLKTLPNILESINGNIYALGIDRLNNMIFNQKIGLNTKIYIVCGCNDEHLENHIVPFCKKNKNNENIKLIIINGNHDDLWNGFSRTLPKVLKDVISEKTNKTYLNMGQLYFKDNFSLHNSEFSIDRNFINLEIKNGVLKVYGQVINKNITYACELLLEENQIKSYDFKEEPYFEFDINSIEENDYYILWKLKDKENAENSIKVQINMINKEENMIYNDNIFHGVKDIKYLLTTQYSSSDLLIIFSTYSNDKDVENTFSHVNTFENLECNKLFILDNYGYNNKGCWFLGENGRLSVEKSVINLINGVIKSLNINLENITLMGFENGGFASIYYGLKYKFINIVAVEPQIYLGQYLKDKDEVVGAILGEKNKSRIDVLDKLISNIEPTEDAKIYLYSSNDQEYINTHINSFFQQYPHKRNVYLDILVANKKNIKVQFDKIAINEINNISKYKNESNIINTESLLMDNMLVKDMDKDIVEDRINVEVSKETLITSIRPLNKNHEYACYLCLNDEIIEKQYYKRYPEFKFNIKEFGEYKLIWYIRDVEKKSLIINVPLEIDIKKKS